MEQEKVDLIYKDGFEHGYWLAKGNSPVLEKLMKDTPKGNYLKGLKAGQKEVKREKIREEFKEMDIDKEKDKSKGLEKEL